MQTPKYKVEETVYVFNLFKPLVAEFLVNGVIRHEEGVFYTHDGKNWVKEDYLYKLEDDAYHALISQAEEEYKQKFVNLVG